MPSENPVDPQAGEPAPRPKQPPLPAPLTRGLHVVAVFEAAKGIIVLAAGVGALSLLNRDASLIAEKLVRYLLLNPDGHLVHYLVERAGHITNRQLLVTAIIATLYSGTRFVEAYGLWKNRAWAEWLAVLGGMVYLPFEISAILRDKAVHALQSNSHQPFEISTIFHRALGLKLALLTLNLLVVGYVIRVLWIKRQARAAVAATATAP